jgi:hypothetical protein
MSVLALQQTLDRLLDAEPWDAVAVERARTKLKIACDAEAREEERQLRQAEAGLIAEKKAREEKARVRDEELYLLQKQGLSQIAVHTQDVPAPLKAARVRTPPPSQRGAAAASAVLGLEADIPQPSVTVGSDFAAVVGDPPLLPRLLASFRADFAQQCGTVSGMLISFSNSILSVHAY